MYFNERVHLKSPDPENNFIPVVEFSGEPAQVPRDSHTVYNNVSFRSTISFRFCGNLNSVTGRIY